MSLEGVHEVLVDQSAAGCTRRLDEHETSRTERTGHPGGDAIACHGPRMRERVDFLQPPRRCKHREVALTECDGDLLRPGDKRRTRQPRHDQVSELVHGENRHPVRGIIGELQLLVYLADRLRERSAAWHDEEPTGPRARTDRGKRGLELPGVRQQTAAELDDRVDGRCTSFAERVRHLLTTRQVR